MKLIPNSKGYYVDVNGYVYKNNNKLKPVNNGSGYHVVNISYLTSKRKTERVHRLVANAFIQNEQKKPCVNHLDGNKTNNRVENLEWVTHRENMIHAYKNGLSNPKISLGSKHYKSKLTELDVVQIMASLSNGVRSSSLAKRYGVSKCTISDINRGVTWKHITNAST